MESPIASVGTYPQGNRCGIRWVLQRSRRGGIGLIQTSLCDRVARHLASIARKYFSRASHGRFSRPVPSLLSINYRRVNPPAASNRPWLCTIKPYREARVECFPRPLVWAAAFRAGSGCAGPYRFAINAPPPPQFSHSATVPSPHRDPSPFDSDPAPAPAKSRINSCR